MYVRYVKVDQDDEDRFMGNSAQPSIGAHNLLRTHWVVLRPCNLTNLLCRGELVQRLAVARRSGYFVILCLHMLEYLCISVCYAQTNVH